MDACGCILRRDGRGGHGIHTVEVGEMKKDEAERGKAPNEEEIDDYVFFTCGNCGADVGKQTPIGGIAYSVERCQGCGCRVDWERTGRRKKA